MKMGRRLLLIAIAALVLVVLVLCLYNWLVLSWSYSEGERAGILQKVSRRGWVFKTWEGELAMTTVPGVAPVLWDFSIRDHAVAERMRDAIGHRVVLHYSEHRGLPGSFYGDTNYFVDEVRIQE
jgi:hypothetical protein